MSSGFTRERKADWGSPLWRPPLSGSSKTAKFPHVYGVGVGEAEAYTFFLCGGHHAQETHPGSRLSLSISYETYEILEQMKK